MLWQAGTGKLLGVPIWTVYFAGAVIFLLLFFYYRSLWPAALTL